MDAPLKTTPKISTKIWRPVAAKLDEIMKSACLRRDAYLNRVLAVEIDALDREISVPNSKASLAFVSKKLDLLDRQLVSLAIEPELSAKLNDVCRRKRIARDAFFNRLFLLLASTEAVDKFLFGDWECDWRTEVWSEYKHERPFFQNGFYPLDPIIDPFWAVRVGLEIYAEQEECEDYLEPESGKTVSIVRDLTGRPKPPYNLYSAYFEQAIKGTTEGTDVDLVALNCFLPDHIIPGQDAAREYRQKLDALLASL